MIGKRLIGALGTGVLFTALNIAQDPPGRTPPPGYPNLPAHITDFNARAAIIRLERMHGGVAWQQRNAVQFTIETTIAGEKPTSSTVLYECTTGRVRVEMGGDMVIIHDGVANWASTKDAATHSAVHNAINLPFLLMAPLRLRDAAFEVSVDGPKRIGLKRYETIRAEARKSSADQSYFILEDAQSRVVGAVLYKTPGTDGNATQRLVRFDAYETIEGITVPTVWKFFLWTDQQGITGEATGTATVSEVSFPVPADDAFTPGEDAVKIGG